LICYTDYSSHWPVLLDWCLCYR